MEMGIPSVLSLRLHFLTSEKFKKEKYPRDKKKKRRTNNNVVNPLS